MEAARLLLLIFAFEGILSKKINSIAFENIAKCNAIKHSYFNSVNLSCQRCTEGSKPTLDGMDRIHCSRTSRYICKILFIYTVNQRYKLIYFACHGTITLGDLEVEVVNSFKYLGVQTTQDEKWDEEVKARISAASLSCECLPNYSFIKRDANGLPMCVECSVDQVSSQDKQRCIKCPRDHPFTKDTGKCSSCGNNEILVEQGLDGVAFPALQCQTCSDQSLANVIEHRCQSCPLSYLKAGNNSCNCPANFFEKIGGECLNKSLLLPNVQSTFAIQYEKENIASSFLKNALRMTDYQCYKLKMQQACQQLANMCILQLLGNQANAENACKRVKKWTTRSGRNPWIFYSRDNVRNIVYADAISTHYKFTSNSPDSRLNFVAALFSANGSLIRLTDVKGGMLQLCEAQFETQDKAFEFGTEYYHQCKIQARDLWDKYDTIFMELYVKFKDGGPKLYPVPVLIQNLKLGDEYDNNGGRAGWQLLRRFTLVDNIGGVEFSHPSKHARFVRYANAISISISFQSAGEGKIEPPIVRLNYEVASHDNQYDKDLPLEVSFSISYYRSKWRVEENLRIVFGVLGSVGALWAVIKTWGWSRRSGKDAIDFLTLIKFLVFVCGNMSNLFFITMFGNAFWHFVLYKRQDEAYLTLPTVAQEETFRLMIYFIFSMKLIQIIDVICTQVLTDIFFLDWERPRELPGKVSDRGEQNTDVKPTAPVSIWRTYFIANEWNELQVSRRINLAVQLLAVLFFLKVVGFEELARIEPKSSFSVHPWSQYIPFSHTARFSIAAVIFLSIAILQYLFKKIIFERFMDDPLQQFVDLCSLSNISVFILYNGRFGYYIHGRAGVGHADTDMREMYEQLKREEVVFCNAPAAVMVVLKCGLGRKAKLASFRSVYFLTLIYGHEVWDDLCSHRGLLPNTDIQTFQVTVPHEIRNQYNKLMIPATSRTVQAGRMQQAGKGNNQSINPDIDRMLTSYMSMNKFLAGFIDHAIRDIDYQVKDKLFLEERLDIEFYDVTTRGIFYNDEKHLFSKTIMLGFEWDLVLLELLLFCVTDLVSTDFLLSAVITFIISQTLKYFRKSWGRRNVAQKTLIDQRFLI